MGNVFWLRIPWLPQKYVIIEVQQDFTTCRLSKYPTGCVSVLQTFREKPNNEIAVGLGGIMVHSRRAYPFVASACVVSFVRYKTWWWSSNERFAIIKIRFGRLKLCNSKYALDFYGATIVSICICLEMRLLWGLVWIYWHFSLSKTSLIALAHLTLDPYDKSWQIACTMIEATINHTVCQQ